MINLEGADGQIGDGRKSLHNYNPSLVKSLSEHNIVKTSCGGGHTAAIDDRGQLFIWGRGQILSLSLSLSLSCLFTNNP